MLRFALASFVSVLAGVPASSQEPVGAIVAWHADLAGTPALPAGWARLDGQFLVDPASPFHGLPLPDLNAATLAGDGRFLRGSALTGFLEDDALQGHAHDHTSNASNGQTYGICPAFMESGFSGFWYRGAAVTVGAPSDDGVNGVPRVDDETRPANMSVVWILKTRASELPVGSIVAWHRDFASLGSPALPPGWALCTGGVLEDPMSPLNGATLPSLNPSGRFLRGGPVSGLFESDAFQEHGHGVTTDAKSPNSSASNAYFHRGGSADPARTAKLTVKEPKSDGTHGVPRTANETRPVNMSVLWVLKTRLGAGLPEGSIVGWHDEPSASLPPLRRGKHAWYACDGRVVPALASPHAGAVLPDLNGPGRFLRGGTNSGILEEDAFQGHWHDVTHDAFSYQFLLEPGSAYWGDCGDDFATGSLSIGGVLGARFAEETRPKNMGVPWILYLRGTPGPRKALASRPLRPATR
jgi:hypothetical protein